MRDDYHYKTVSVWLYDLKCSWLLCDAECIFILFIGLYQTLSWHDDVHHVLRTGAPTAQLCEGTPRRCRLRLYGRPYSLSVGGSGLLVQHRGAKWTSLGVKNIATKDLAEDIEHAVLVSIGSSAWAGSGKVPGKGGHLLLPPHPPTALPEAVLRTLMGLSKKSLDFVWLDTDGHHCTCLT